MIPFLRYRLRSFRYAFAGWWYVIRTQKNAWIHALATIAVFILGLWLEIPFRDWAVIILAVALVWTAEFLNSALETVVDLASPQHHRLAQVGKDVGAAAVLIAAASSALIGILVIGPPLWAKVTSWLAPP